MKFGVTFSNFFQCHNWPKSFRRFFKNLNSCVAKNILDIINAQEVTFYLKKIEAKAGKYGKTPVLRQYHDSPV